MRRCFLFVQDRNVKLCPMAVYKLSKAKLFYVFYCGCSAAVRLLNEEHIVETVARVRQKTFKQDYLRTVLSVSTDGIRLNYQNSSHNSTFVPSSMIAGSTIGNYPFDDTVGSFSRLFLLSSKLGAKSIKRKLIRHSSV